MCFNVRFFLNCHFSFILIIDYCPMEEGFCVKENGCDQNSGVLTINNVDGHTTEAQEQCLEICKQTKGATGCEVIWGRYNRGCYVHTQEIAKGNGVRKHACWVFSKCKGK